MTYNLVVFTPNTVQSYGPFGSEAEVRSYARLLGVQRWHVAYHTEVRPALPEPVCPQCMVKGGKGLCSEHNGRS
jgi:hypothetical protein